MAGYNIIPAEPPPQFDRDVLVFVLQYLCRIEELFLGAHTSLKNYPIFQGHSDLSVIWREVRNYFRQYRRLPPPDILRFAVHQALKAEPETASVALKTVDYVFNTPCSQEGIEYVRDRLQDLIRLAALYKLRVTDPDEVTPDALQQVVDDINGISVQTSFRDIFSEGGPVNFLNQTAKIPTGVSFIDRFLNGGVYPTTTLAIIAPTGSGKTTLGLQLAMESVRRKRHVAYLSIEQPFDGDIALRISTLMADSKRSDWEKGPDRVPPKVLERYKRNAPLWQEYFHWNDTWTDPSRMIRDVAELFVPVDHLIRQGKKPFMMILDWWHLVRADLRMFAPSTKEADVRDYLYKQLAGLLQRSKQREIVLVVLQQLRGAKGAQRRSVGTVYDGMEDSSFGQLFDFAIVGAKLDADYNTIFKLDKARGAREMIQHVHLNGERCRFESYDPDSTSRVLNIEDFEDLQAIGG